MSLMNTTAMSHGTIIDGKLLSGDMLWQITSHGVFTWTLLDNFTFRNFAKPIAVRQYTWSAGPYIIFRNCVFEDSTADLFSLNGGTIIFENCAFRNLTGRPIKTVGEVTADFVDCTFDNCQALFFSGSDASFTNCRFLNMRGQRGGAIYAAKTTLFVGHCIFVNCQAQVNGGAIYIRESNERFESEVANSCFVRTHAGVNGSAIYSYLSHLSLNQNCFESELAVSELGSSLEISGTLYDDKCAECQMRIPTEYIPIDYTPVDTNKWYQFDNLEPGTTIVIDEDDEL